MKQLLGTTESRILEGRIEISRSIGLFERKDLARGFGISLSTLHRYTNPDYRELSRRLARKQTMRNYRNTNGLCENRVEEKLCREPLSGHQRCGGSHVSTEGCAILLHDAERFLCESCEYWNRYHQFRTSVGADTYEVTMVE